MVTKHNSLYLPIVSLPFEVFLEIVALVLEWQHQEVGRSKIENKLSSMLERSLQKYMRSKRLLELACTSFGIF